MAIPDLTPDWGPPDAVGLSTARLTDPLRASLKDRRRRRAVRAVPLDVDTWPAEWRVMLVTWVKRRDQPWVKRDVLLKAAGAGRAHDMDHVIDLLLRGGCLEIEERFERGSWWLHAVSFTGAARLRAALGLPEPDATLQAWAGRRDQRFDDSELDAAADALAELPPARALARMALLDALARWTSESRSGTWRDFSQFSRGDTKAIGASERAWLNEVASLGARGIDDHTPLLLLRAPLRLHGPTGVLDLGASGDFIGLSPRTLSQATSVDGRPACWRLVENRSSFERVARAALPEDGVVWLPGYPPSWWLTAVRTLLAHAPASAFIACDPDPDGIAIALHAAALWTGSALDWAPWKMSAEDLAGLPVRRPLTERDRDRLAVLRSGVLPPVLLTLAEWMEAHGEKGEQEAML